MTDASSNSAAEHVCKHVRWHDGREWADCSCGWQSPERDATRNRVRNCGACNPDRSIPCTCTFVAAGGKFLEANGRFIVSEHPDPMKYEQDLFDA